MQYLNITFKKSSIIRFHFVTFFLLIFIISFFYTIYHNHDNKENEFPQKVPTHLFDVNTSTYSSISKLKYESSRLVLLWTSLFEQYYWHQEYFFNSSTIVSCSSIHKCQFTRDKTRLSQASTVAFHLYDMNRYELPERRKLTKHNQTLIFVTGESPINFYYHNPSFLPYVLDQYFDRSISYKYDSLYSVYAPKMKSRIISNETLLYTKEMIYERQLNLKSLEYKKKPIVWIVSNCITFSQREKYVEELKKFIHIDIYGRCGTRCSEKQNRQCHMDLNQYYFYLAFENSRCKSYITEKFWNIIGDKTHRLVPIVMGAYEDDYQRIAPKKSYIHVNDYKTPEDLATYLHYLIKNPKGYLEYLQWREYTDIQFKRISAWMNLLCPLCQIAYDNQLSSNARINFSSWYNPQSDCHSDDVEMYKKCKQTNLRTWMSLIHNVQCP